MSWRQRSDTLWISSKVQSNLVIIITQVQWTNYFVFFSPQVAVFYTIHFSYNKSRLLRINLAGSEVFVLTEFDWTLIQKFDMYNLRKWVQLMARISAWQHSINILLILNRLFMLFTRILNILLRSIEVGEPEVEVCTSWGHHQVTGIELNALNRSNVTSVEDADLEASVGVPDMNSAVGRAGDHEL